MSLETAIKARLDGFADLKSLVRSRNYAIRYPDDVDFPATTLEILAENPTHAMGRDANVKETRIRVNSFSTDFDNTKDVDEQVRKALSRFRGTSGGTVVQDIMEITVNDIYHAELGVGVYQRARDFRVFYEVT